MIEKTRIEASVEGIVDPGLLKLVAADEPILVSGQPLRVFHPTDSGEDRFFAECAPMDEEVLRKPFIMSMQRFGSSESNLPDHFLPAEDETAYPVLRGFTVDGFEVVLGIRQALGFTFKAAPTSEQ